MDQLLKTAFRSANIDFIKDNFDPNILINGYTLLHMACDNRDTPTNREEIVRFLLSKNVDVNVKSKWERNALYYACESRESEIVKLLINIENMDINNQDRHGNTSLHKMCERGYTKIVKLLLTNKNIKTNIKNKDELTPLQVACYMQNLDIIKLLLVHNDTYKNEEIDINFSNRESSALHIVCRKGDIECLKLLLNIKGIDINFKRNMSTVLHIACFDGSVEIVKLLLSVKDLDINAKDRSGRTALHIACSRGNVEIIKLLLNVGEHNIVDIDSRCNMGYTPLHIAYKLDCKEIMEILINPPLTGRSSGADVNLRYEEGHTLLHIVCCYDMSIEMVKFLLSVKNIDLNIQDDYGQTALHAVLSSDDEKVVPISKLLINADKERTFDIRDEHGCTPLYLACYSGHMKIVELIYKKNVRSDEGSTLLHAACYDGHLEVVKFLVNNGEDVNVKDNYGERPLYIACNNRNFEVVKFLVKNGADVNAQNRDGVTPFGTLCIGPRCIEIMRFLLENCDVDINIRSKFGLSYLHGISSNGSLDELKLLLENRGKDINFNLHDEDGNTALHLACKRKKKNEIVKYLLEEYNHKISINTMNDDYESILYLIVKNCNVECIKNALKIDNANIDPRIFKSLIGHKEYSKFESSICNYFNKCFRKVESITNLTTVLSSVVVNNLYEGSKISVV